MLVATKVCLSRQKYACRDKYIFVATNRILLRQFKTRLLSRQKYACRDKYLSLQRFCRGKHTFVATKDVLCCVKTRVCRHKDVFVATKMIPVAAPANDITQCCERATSKLSHVSGSSFINYHCTDIFAAQGSSQNKNLTRSCPLWPAGLIC